MVSELQSLFSPARFYFGNKAGLHEQSEYLRLDVILVQQPSFMLKMECTDPLLQLLFHNLTSSQLKHLVITIYQVLVLSNALFELSKAFYKGLSAIKLSNLVVPISLGPDGEHVFVNSPDNL